MMESFFTHIDKIFKVDMLVGNSAPNLKVCFIPDFLVSQKISGFTYI